MGEYWCCSIRCMSKADSTGGLTYMRLEVCVAAGRELASWGTLAHTEPEEQINQWTWDMKR